MFPQQTDWDVEFRFEAPPQSVSFVVEGEMLLGRTPNGQADTPSFDLSNYGGVELGVSRRHGVLRNEKGILTYTDLGAGNGTILNGVTLKPNEAIRISSGDALYLGHLRITIGLKQHPRKTSILAIKPNFKLSATMVKGAGQRVLVVEDDPGLAEMYRLALERNGFVVQHAREMVTAIRALNHQIPAAILLDLMLPGIRGLELARYVRRDAESPNIPIIVCSALRDKESITGAMDAGADVFMGKPVDWKELAQVVGSVVGPPETTPGLQQTKRLRGTARLDVIPTEMRQDTLIVFVDNEREPITLMVQPTLTMGRQNPSGTGRTHIDLDPYKAYDKGVSRVHMTIRRNNTTFEVEDMNSANGSYLNNEQLSPGKFYPVKNADELRLGNMRLRLYVLADADIPKAK
jgi:DNA-binding response OmpR family regulator